MVWFLSVSTDMIDGIKKWKRRALSTQNDLALKKTEVNWSSSFCCIARARIAFWMDGRMDRQTMSNAIVVDRLLAASAISLDLSLFYNHGTLAIINDVHMFR